MKIYVPDYYEHFKCIADKCRHSCCIGWEIDIDDYTMEIYHSIGGELGGKLRSNINVTSDGARFILDKNERCPFLCENGLCELILEKGEDILCDICTDHPRFRNFYSDRIEMGLGLCCEAAAELILGREKPAQTVLLTDDGVYGQSLEADEEMILTLKNELISALQDNSVSYSQRAENAVVLCGGTKREFSGRELSEILFPLERLDSGWDEILQKLSEFPDTVPLPDYTDIWAERLAVYFTYRHLSAQTEDAAAVMSFVVFSTEVIIRAATAVYEGRFTTSQLAEIARMYSAEIEYSDENISAIIDELNSK